jgi:RecB family exonuclease
VSAPRAIGLVRVDGWRAAHRAIAALSADGGPIEARARAVVVPSHGAAWQLRRTLERLLLVEGWRPSARDAERLGLAPAPPGASIVLPDLLTRDEWYGQLHAATPPAPALLDGGEREVVLRAACDEASEAGLEPPFTLRPGLVAEILAFYDQLRRQKREVADVQRLCAERLEASVETDRGAARMLQQTRFLVAALERYEARLAALGAVDEHGWRDRLNAGGATSRHRHLVITVADQVAEPSGLWPCDFDALTRLDGLERIDVVATEALLATGLHERLHERLPGIEEYRPRDLEGVVSSQGPGIRGHLLVPPRQEDRFYFLARDREDELAGAIRRLVAHEGVVSDAEGTPSDTALVYQRPLPYLYVARQLLDSAGLAYEAFDALPLAAEPAAAALDLIVEFVASGHTRQATLSLLGSPHLRHEVGGRPVSRGDVSRFEDVLRDHDFTAGRERLEAIAASLASAAAGEPRHEGAASAAQAATAAATALERLEQPARTSEHVDVLLAFLESHLAPTEADAPWAEREQRARAAVRQVLLALRQAHVRHGDRVVAAHDTAAAIRRRIEAHTFAPRTGSGGIHLVDEPAARYGTFGRVQLLGLVEGEWPGGSRRNVFFPAWILRDLGWPPEEGRQAAARAAFGDMLRLAGRETAVSAFSLEDDALVRPSVLLEDVPGAGLVVERVDASAGEALFPHELLARGATTAATGANASASAAEWIALRAARPDPALPQYHGASGPTTVETHSVTAVETYLQCPFRYFASRVLGLEEERPDEPGLDPRQRGTFEHQVFERFFREWDGEGFGAITTALVPVARERFRALVEEMVAALPGADAAVERVRLLGSPVVAGIGERVFRLEAQHAVLVVARELEFDLGGPYDLVLQDRSLRVSLRGIADRVDLLADGTLRVVDYKSGRAPDVKRAIQLPVYGWCAEQRLAGERGRAWRVSEAAYIAFGEKRPHVSVIASEQQRDQVVPEALDRLAGAIEAIARGEFPPRPEKRSLCATCAFASVCRRDYVDAD